MNQILSEISDATLSKLITCWFKWRADGDYPIRKRIEPIELGSALPHVWICQKDNDDQTYRYRLVGEAVNSLYGQGLRGRTPSDFLSEQTAEMLHKRLDECLSTGIILHTIAPQTIEERQHVLIERLFLPVIGTCGALNTILGCTKITDSVTESRRHNTLSQETSYSRDGVRIRSLNTVATMFSGELNHRTSL